MSVVDLLQIVYIYCVFSRQVPLLQILPLPEISDTVVFTL